MSSGRNRRYHLAERPCLSAIRDTLLGLIRVHAVTDDGRSYHSYPWAYLPRLCCDGVDMGAPVRETRKHGLRSLGALPHTRLMAVGSAEGCLGGSLHYAEKLAIYEHACKRIRRQYKRKSRD